MLFSNKSLLADWFKPLRILPHTETRHTSDFFGRQKMDTIRFLARKER